MGCDIHAYLEYRNDEGQWVYAGYYRKNDYATRNSDDYGYGMMPFEPADVIHDRSYDMFSRMAGVRGELPPGGIEPRGFPEDASPEVRVMFESWGSDAHTPSWLTRSEIEGNPAIHNGDTRLLEDVWQHLDWRVAGFWQDEKQMARTRIVFFFDN